MKNGSLTAVISSICFIASLTACASMAQLGTSIAASTGAINAQQAASINRSAAAVEKSFEDITPEQEYYIGRAVGANVLRDYKPYDKEAAAKYLNFMLKALSQVSNRPETFGGYHVLILDSDQINAFAAPGGFIFVTRGMLRCCATESALAAVLAHEVAHVQFEHGLKAIKKDRLTSALTILGTETAKTLGAQELKDLTTAFEGSITDVTRTMVNSGYSRESEEEADGGAVDILTKAGYNPAGLVDMLQEMKKRLKPGGPDFAKTHPDPDYRIGVVRKKIGTVSPLKETDAMPKRFRAALDGI
jgi:beta-barrel assembly-enhancing protease